MDGIQKTSKPVLVGFGGLHPFGARTLHRFTRLKIRFCISLSERHLASSFCPHSLSSAQLAVPTVWTAVFLPFGTARFELSDSGLWELPIAKILWSSAVRSGCCLVGIARCPHSGNPVSQALSVFFAPFGEED